MNINWKRVLHPFGVAKKIQNGNAQFTIHFNMNSKSEHWTGLHILLSWLGIPKIRPTSHKYWIANQKKDHLAITTMIAVGCWLFASQCRIKFHSTMDNVRKYLRRATDQCFIKQTINRIWNIISNIWEFIIQNEYYSWMKYVHDVESNIEPLQAHAKTEYFPIDYQEKCSLSWSIESPPNQINFKVNGLWLCRVWNWFAPISNAYTIRALVCPSVSNKIMI